ncbi:hypothetical protein PG994_007267 [Apiospora phragmitis]|uniref:Uncharacterized protein n=1 Tax=Apiospora phragmitis TaxID=2905665 RepID=A0ABR1V0B9_9PEZI
MRGAANNDDDADTGYVPWCTVVKAQRAQWGGEGERTLRVAHSTPHDVAVPADALYAAVADEVVDVQVLVVVVGAVAPDSEPLLPGRRAADLELLLVGDGPAALADAAERFGRAHGL